MTPQTPASLTLNSPTTISGLIHPWLNNDPINHALYLHREYRKNNLLAKISIIAISIFSLTTTIAALFITSKPLFIFLTFVSLCSPSLLYVSAQFSQQAAAAKKSFDKISAIAEEQKIIQNLSLTEQQKQLSIFNFSPLIPIKNQIYLLARHRYLDKYQQQTQLKIEKYFNATSTEDLPTKLFHRNLAWEILTKEYLPSFLEKSFCHFVAQNPYTTNYPSHFVNFTPKNFAEFSFNEKFDNDTSYLHLKDKNTKPIGLWEFQKLTKELSSQQLYQRFFQTSDNKK